MCWYGRLYDIFLGTLLRSVRLWIALKVRSSHCFPVLDLCCGTGDQLRRIDLPDQLTVGVDRDFPLLSYASSRKTVIPWICADAGSLPFRTASFRCVMLSFSLHEKSPDSRRMILREARRVVRHDGFLLFLDYENPWNILSRLGSLMIWTIERFAGGNHFRSYRHFMASGGLRSCLKKNEIAESESRLLRWGSSRIVISKTNKSELSSSWLNNRIL